MNTTILNYPGFQTLPKGIKQMLLISEAHFFDQLEPRFFEQKGAAQVTRASRRFEVTFQKGAEYRPVLIWSRDTVPHFSPVI